MNEAFHPDMSRDGACPLPNWNRVPDDAVAGAGGSATPGGPPAGAARVVVSVDQLRFFLGENVLVRYCVEHVGETIPD
jgi:hypothetical protein